MATIHLNPHMSQHLRESVTAHLKSAAQMGRSIFETLHPSDRRARYLYDMCEDVSRSTTYWTSERRQRGDEYVVTLFFGAPANYRHGLTADEKKVIDDAFRRLCTHYHFATGDLPGLQAAA